jgi:hypothetical protein
MQTRRIQEKVQDLFVNGYDFQANEYLRSGYNMLRDRFWFFIGYAALVLVTNAVIGYIPVLGFLATTFVLGPVFNAGYFIVAEKVVHEEEPEFNTFFKGFTYVGQLALYTLVYMGIILILFIPTVIALFQAGLFEMLMEFIQDPLADADYFDIFNPSPSFFIILFLNFIPLIYVGVAYWWTPMFIVFHEYSFWEAMETSRKLVTRKWFAHFGLGVLFFLISLAALLAMIVVIWIPLVNILAIFLVALVLTVVFQLALFHAFLAVVGTRSQEEEKDDLLDHLVEGSGE